MQGDRHSGVRSQALIIGGEEEGSKGAPGPMRLEREESVQYLWVSLHPVLKLLQRGERERERKRERERERELQLHTVRQVNEATLETTYYTILKAVYYIPGLCPWMI